MVSVGPGVAVGIGVVTSVGSAESIHPYFLINKCGVTDVFLY